MKLSRYVARQLAYPSGFFGKYFLPWYWNRHNAALNDVALTALEPAAHDHILEVGFGGAYLLVRLATIVTAGRLTGVDVSASLVARARQRLKRALRAGHCEVLCGPAEKLPLGDAQFTKVVSVNSAFYWRDGAAALAEMRRVLVPEGRLVLCLTRRCGLANRGFEEQGFHLYEAEDLRAPLERAGFVERGVTFAADRHRPFFCLTATAFRRSSV